MTDALPHPNSQATHGENDEQMPDEQDIINVLDGYKSEARQAREGGPNPRDDVWRKNWDRYWGRYDFSDKADWQAQHAMPEVPQFVDRWASAMREALDPMGEWFSIVDAGEQDTELVPHIKRAMEAILTRCGVTADGHRVDFSSVFEDQMKLAAIMMGCGSVTWKDDDQTGGWVSVDTVDPREVYLDPKGRNLYRWRRYEIDKHELLMMAEATDDDGNDIYNIDKIRELQAYDDQERREERERATGHGEGEPSANRHTITIDEWLCTLLMPDGSVPAVNSLIVVANDRHIIRGPEANPFWHGKDWIVATPMVSVPMSVYGRSYMEDWTEVSDAFVEMTNLILDSTFMSAVRSFVAAPDMLKNPRQLNEGVTPGKVFELEDGVQAADFIKEIELGSLGADVIRVWESLKNEMREGAKLSQMSLGQLPSGDRHSATMAAQVEQSGNSMIRSMARTIEVRWLEVVLTQVWQVALQHMDFLELTNELGQATAEMLNNHREEFANRKIRFRVTGISGLIDRQNKLQNLMSLLQVVGQNDVLMQALMQETSPDKLVSVLFQLHGVDINDIRLSEREQQQRAAVRGNQAAAGQQQSVDEAIRRAMAGQGMPSGQQGGGQQGGQQGGGGQQ